jgi:hypothetical protein
VTLSAKPVRFIAWAVCLGFVAACARTRVPDLEPGDRRTFRASSAHTELFVVGDFEGLAEVWTDSILVLVTRGRIDTRGRPDDGVSLRVVLANGDTAERWKAGDASSAAPLPSIRRDEAGRLLEPLRFTVKRHARPLSDHWLAFVFEVESGERAPDGRPLLHTAFAHSQRDLFAPRPGVGESHP